MKRFMNTYLKYVFIFAFSLFVLTIFSTYANTWDALWSYEFSYSIVKGEIPYIDFVMIIPPFYNYLMAIGLLISHNNFVFLIEQAFLITFCFYFLFKIFDYKAWLMLALMCFPWFCSFSATYNFFLYFLFLLLFYLEENQKSDYLIGFIIGLMLLTKHTVGFFFLFPSIIIYRKNWKKNLSRMIGFFIPCIMFLIYLLICGNFFQFLDLCVLGLVDFANKNTYFSLLYFIPSIAFFALSVLILFRNPKNILCWYVLFAFSIMFPNFSEYHFFVYILFIGVLFLFVLKDKIIPKHFVLTITFSIVFLTVIFQLIQFVDFKNKSLMITEFKDVSNFNLYFGSKNAKKELEYANNLYTRYKKKGNTYFLSREGDLWLKIIHEEKTNYFTILNKGNYGYDGTNKMKNKIDQMNNVFFIVDNSAYLLSKNESNFSDVPVNSTIQVFSVISTTCPR